MLKEKDFNSRTEYLLRALEEWMNTCGVADHTVDYDEATCDGICLLEDIKLEIDFLLDT